MLKLHGLSCHRTLKRHECLIYIKLYAMEWLPTYLNLHFWQNKKQSVYDILQHRRFIFYLEICM